MANNSNDNSQPPKENEKEDNRYVEEMAKLKKPPLPLQLDFIRKKGFELYEEIGTGKYSTVYKATWSQKPNVWIACKRINIRDAEQEWKDNCLQRELSIVKKLKHKNIINIFEVFKTEDLVFIFMAMAEKGSILQFMHNEQKPLKEIHAKIWFNDMINGVAYLHAKGVAHRDLKLDNVLLDADNTAIISDFGFAVYDETRQLLRGTLCGTFEYMAPEVYNKRENQKYDAKKADIYSLGVCLYEMINYHKPFEDENQYRITDAKLKRKYRLHSKIEKMCSKDIKDLIHQLLEPNPQKRITITDIIEHKGLKY